MSVPMDSQCYLCHLRRHVGNARALGDESTATAFAQELMQLYIDAPADAGSPWFGPHLTAMYKKYYGITGDRFLEEKQESNRFVMARMDAIRALVEAQPDPVYAGLQFAVLGNYIDFSALQGEVSFEKLDEMLKTGTSLELDRENYRRFCADLETGKTLLYVTDNAGEIGFDRICAEQIQKKYPHIAITFCVRGGPANNDALREDAEAVGIPFPVIDNGTCIAGTQLDMVSQETLTALRESDVVLSKGQANVETMLGCGYNIYYAFLIKCQRFITLFDKPKLTPMFHCERP
ncbi:MAG: DUF89 family protein [Oscillospiraceae bacterium]|nr:DUF89 family protein [Oscillospiraceae bacterium]